MELHFMLLTSIFLPSFISLVADAWIYAHEEVEGGEVGDNVDDVNFNGEERF
ncbi:hypothetical protein SLEP1_g27021 [Rubroshorea leprosula]|uniref:Uncharacterized protein n=1 Tax=Rubroshorea leprosula TaxID=152421 RepID=A0AAV5JP88_9ROSI|nr:hypothetical protein SLEP1_g27021 [Rubroshorea leprosula]